MVTGVGRATPARSCVLDGAEVGATPAVVRRPESIHKQLLWLHLHQPVVRGSWAVSAVRNRVGRLRLNPALRFKAAQPQLLASGALAVDHETWWV